MAKWSIGWSTSLTSSMAPEGDQSEKGAHMPTRSDSLKERLSRYNEINLTVTGRKSGRAITNPVWFVFEDDKLYLLPVKGSDTQWYK